FGIDLGEAREGVDLVVVRLHERMRHGAEERDAELGAGEHRRRPRVAREVGCAGGEEPGFGAVRAPEPEVDELAPGRGEDAARRLARHHRLELYDVDEPRLDEL